MLITIVGLATCYRPMVGGRQWGGGRSAKSIHYGLLLAIVLTVTAFQSTAQAKCQHGTAEQAKNMVERAVELIGEVGINRAFWTFLDPAGGFLEGNLYIFAVDFHGTLLMNGNAPRAIGSNALGARDAEGRYYVQQMIRLARESGEGWVQYEFFDPCTGRSSPKSSFIKRVGDFLIGVGYYGALVV